MPDEVERKETGSDKSGAGAADPPSRAAPSLAILGADALLVARPATAVQLAHACLRIGYHAVVPASWGDELIAGGCLRQIASRRSTGNTGPAIFCACPYVAHRLLAVGPDLEPFFASFVAPPVAVARYLHALYEPSRVRLTYVGRCPGAADDAIDARLTPEELLAVLTERGIDLADQPRVFDSVIPPDRRRFLSQPGGLPAAEMLRRVDPERKQIDVAAGELATELAQILLSKRSVLIDLAPRLGCACSGASANVAAEAARGGVTALEPPRASSPIVDERVPVTIELPLPQVARTPIDVVPSVASRRTSGSSRAGQPAEPHRPAAPAAQPGGQADTQAGVTGPISGGRRRSPAHGVAVRPHAGAIPTTRTSGEGRALPRAYVARRNAGARGRGPSTPPRGQPQQFDASGGGRGGARADNGRSGRGEGLGPPRAEQVETPTAMATPPSPSARPVSVPAPSATPLIGGGPSGQTEAMRSPRPAMVGAAVGAAPDRAVDPHGEPIVDSGATAVAEHAGSEPTPEAELRAPPAPPRGPPRISEPTAAQTPTFRERTATVARLAVTTANQRRALLAALLAVAALSASVGVLAGRWLAARTTVGAVR